MDKPRKIDFSKVELGKDADIAQQKALDLLPEFEGLTVEQVKLTCEHINNYVTAFTPIKFQYLTS